MTIKQEKKIGVFEAAQQIENVRRQNELQKSMEQDADFLKREACRSGLALAEAAIAAFPFLGPFDFGIVDVQKCRPSAAPDWVVIRDSTSGTLMKFDLISNGPHRQGLNDPYSNDPDDYIFSVVVTRTGWYLKSRFREHVGYQWKAVSPTMIEDFDELTQALQESDRIIGKRMAT